MRDIKLLKRKISDSKSFHDSIEVRISKLEDGISGSNNLVQRVLKLFLTERGSNAYYTELGSSIRDLKEISNSGSKKAIFLATKQSISQVQEYIISEQNVYNNLSSEELLDKIEILDIFVDENTNIWNIQLAIYDQSGKVNVLEI